MGLFDDAVPGGSIAKPLMIALGALLVGKMMGGGSRSEPAPTSQSPQAGAGGLGGMLQGGLAGGLGSLLERFNSTGQGTAASSWVGTGPNQPIAPQQVGSALGQTTVSDLARQSGMSEQELLAQLSRVLPGVVDKLTPGGRVPDQTEIAPHFRF
jgi:uncharacterized protein YidB (DUF937 family)